MRRRAVNYLILLFAILFLAVNCAKISSPSGGPKDLDPPVVVNDEPRNGSANFTGNSFTVTFNEYIVLNSITDKFMVSPPLAKNPQTTVRGKSLIVEFDEKLKDSTTYTFYFQDAIRDLNESNPINNYQFVFSTGPVVDSLSVAGKVYNSLTLEESPDQLVLMHKNLADTAPRKELPVYITKTDKRGSFRINNVREGSYKLYALGDKNNNKRYDQPDETFAFLDSVIVVNAITNDPSIMRDTIRQDSILLRDTIPVKRPGEYILYTFTGPRKTQYLTSSVRNQAYSLIYTFALPLDTARFDIFIPGEKDNSYFIEENDTRDTFKIWLTDSTLYNSEVLESIVKHPITDSTGLLVTTTDTVPLRYIAPRAVRGIRGPDKLSYTLNVQTGTLKPKENITIKALSPLIEPDTSRIKLFELKDTLKLKVPYSIAEDPDNASVYNIDSQLKENGQYLLVVDSAALSNMYGNVSDSVGIKFTVRTAISFGSLTVNITGYNEDIIVQLLDNNEKVVQEAARKGEGKVAFSLIEKGLYRLRVIYDLDGNGRWTTGDYDASKQSEPASYFPNALNVKENWDMIEDWDMSDKNFKNQTLRKVVPGT